MEDFSATSSPDAHGVNACWPLQIGDPAEWRHADDPLGDEAAFPTTWQHLAAGEAAHD